MFKKLHLYGARLRMATLLLISGVTIVSTRSCNHPTQQTETSKSAQKTIAYNEALSKVLNQVWQKNDAFIPPLDNESLAQLQKEVVFFQESLQEIADGQVDKIDPTLVQFFQDNGVEHELKPEIAFKKLLPSLPDYQDETKTVCCTKLIDALSAYFECAFEKCKAAHIHNIG